jgi:uncharacterized protein YrrD
MRQLRSMRDLSGYTLHARDGDIGKVREIYFDDQNWKVRYFVVRTGGWLLGRDVLILPEMIDKVDEDDGRIDVKLNREQIRHCPPTENQFPVSRHYEREFYRYYDWEPYWGADPLFGPGPGMPPLATDDEPHEPEHPHLRSSAEVTGYGIRAQDGELGTVRDFIIEDPGWTVRYLDVATGKWLFGKDVLMACAWIEGVDWSDKNVAIALTREAIETAPAYDASQVISREYEIELYKHYGMRFEND